MVVESFGADHALRSAFLVYFWSRRILTKSRAGLHEVGANGGGGAKTVQPLLVRGVPRVGDLLFRVVTTWPATRIAFAHRRSRARRPISIDAPCCKPPSRRVSCPASSARHRPRICRPTAATS